MNEYLVLSDLPQILAKEVRRPSIVWWNRLEGEPRARDFTRALEAEARDPLWLVTRQWQMGEFVGDDAGSPITAKVAWSTDTVAEVVDEVGNRRAFDADVPIEAIVEARPVPFERAGGDHNALLRLALGRRWQQLLAPNHAARIGDFRNTYGFAAPDRVAQSDFEITAHPEPWQMLAVISGRAIDGGALLIHLATPGALASDGLGLVDPEKSEIDALGDQFVQWAERRYLQPDEALDTWIAWALEYRAGLSAPVGTEPAALGAPDYRGGRLDWFNFDAVPAGPNEPAGTEPPLEVTSFMPTIASFDGMPNTRHWSFEEGAVSFGAIRPDTTDLAKLLLIEFGLLYANDWFLLPMALPVGSLTRIRGLAVTNTFGERFWIGPAETEAGPTASWRMYRLTPRGRTDDRLFLPPTTPAGLESQPVEAASLIRDEMANMVWGIETTVQLADGLSYPGREAALELHRRHAGAIGPATIPPATDAEIKYRLMRTPAEHWIPFIPVHIPGDNREIQLQRSALPRLLRSQTGPPDKIEPRTGLLRQGLDETPQFSYFVAEEEVERAGRVVELRWQRCRTSDGTPVLWLAHRVTTGRGEGSSGLAFDTIEPISD